jgi:LTXXQ motif family protein
MDAEMEPKMRRLLLTALLATTIPATAVLAQAPPQPEPQQKQARPARPSPETLGRLQDGRIAMMKEALKLNDAQLKLWAPLEQQIRARYAARQQARQDREQRRQQGAAAPSPTDRLDRATQRMTQRAERMQKYAAAFKPFYQSLSDDQKAVASIVLRDTRVGHRGHGRRWAMRGAPEAPQPPAKQ